MLLLLLLSYGLVSIKLLCGLLRCVLGAFRPPPLLHQIFKKIDRIGRPNCKTCNCVVIGGQHCQAYGFPTAMPNGWLPSESDMLTAGSCHPSNCNFSKAKQWCW
jgi:hypothetical protein